MALEREHCYLTQVEKLKLDQRHCLYHKRCDSYGLAINLMKRDISFNPLKFSQSQLPEDLANRLIESCEYISKESPHLDGILEGLVRVNPWLLPSDSYIFVEVSCRFVYYSSRLEKQDYEEDFCIFKRTHRLLPHDCESMKKDCLKNQKLDTDKFSSVFSEYFENLGGYVGTEYEKAEFIDRNGANVPLKQTRMGMTCIPRTQSILKTNRPDHPYIILNLPFRFDISEGPESVIFKNNCKISHKNRPRRFSLPDFYRENTLDRMSFENQHLNDLITEEQWDLEDLIRLTGMKKSEIRNRFNQMKTKKLQEDQTHPSSYEYLKRLKRLPFNGIHWTVKAYAAVSSDAIPNPKHVCSMVIRKTAWLPAMDELRLICPPKFFDDYHLALRPDSGTPAGVISVYGTLGQSFYSHGDPVEVFIKVHNESVRCIQAIEVELIQNVFYRFNPGRVNRTVICKRILDTEHYNSVFPIKPCQTNVILSAKLYPWPSRQQCQEILEKIKQMESTQVDYELQAWNLHSTKRSDEDLAIMYPSPEKCVPPYNLNDLHPASSTLDMKIFDLLYNSRSRYCYEKNEKHRRKQELWSGNPYSNCLCISSKKEKEEREAAFPPRQPYQLYMNYEVSQSDGIDLDYERMKDFLRNRQEYFYSSTETFAHKIDYEVQFRAVLRDQNTYYFHNDTTAKTGEDFMNANIETSIYGHLGPQLSLPLIYYNNEKNYENYNIPLRNERFKRYHEIPVSRQTITGLWNGLE